MIILSRGRNTRKLIRTFVKQLSHFPKNSGTVTVPRGTVLRFIRQEGVYRLTSIRTHAGDGLLLQHHGNYQLSTEWHCVEIAALMDALETDRLYIGRNLCVIDPKSEPPRHNLISAMVERFINTFTPGVK